MNSLRNQGTLAMEVLGMESFEDEPFTKIIPPDVRLHQDDEWREILHSIATAVVVDSFVDLSVFFKEKECQDEDSTCICL